MPCGTAALERAGVHYHEKLRISCKLLRGRLAHGDKPLWQALPFDQRLFQRSRMLANPPVRKSLRSLFKTPIGPLCGGIKYFGVKRFS